MENLVGNATTLGVASRVLDDEMLLMSAEEMKAIEENKTWVLIVPLLGC